MKLLIVGASGMIGAEVLKHCLAHSEVSKVVAFVRRELPGEATRDQKLEVIVLDDFAAWPQHILQEHAEAAGMIWNMGSYNADRSADLDYPLAFVESMGRVLQSMTARPPFRYVQLSGKWARSDQGQRLWWGEDARKLKGLVDAKVLEYATNHPDIWKSFVVKPGPVGGGPRLTPDVPRSWGTDMIASLLGVRIDELAAFMTFLAVDGRGEDVVAENGHIASRGRELLKQQGEY